jgi:uncharacterized membrane protein
MREWLIQGVHYVVPVIEAVGVAIVVWGALEGFARLLARGWQIATGAPLAHSFGSIRLGIGEKMVLGLEFFLAGDVIQTIVVPTLESLGILAGIVAIRSVIVYFLERELRAGEKR